jgi:exopolysaccharide biosynthesis polyprenyl glycosylphosphotransferase
VEERRVTSRDAKFDVKNDITVIPDMQDSRVVDLTKVIDGVHRPNVEGTAGLKVGTSALRRYRLVAFGLVVIDVLCVAMALLVAHVLRFGSLPGQDYLIGIVVAGVLWLGVFHALGLYAPQHLSALEEFRRTLSAVGIGIVVVILLTFWLDVYLSRSWMAITLAIALVLELTARIIVRAYVSRLRARRSLVLRTLVIGNREQADEPIEALRKPESGFLPLGYVDATSPLLASKEMSPIERVNRLRFVFRQYRPDCIFLASATIGPTQMLTVMQAARQEGVLVRIYTHLSGVWASRLTAQPFGKEGVTLTVKPAGLSAAQRIIKRAMDVVLASTCLIVASPVLIVAAIAIKVTSGGPVLFRQDRVTEGARIFRMYKFRSMSNGAEHGVEEHMIDSSAPFFKLKTDPRLTKVGKWLRGWSIDELPQLFNVLLGDMSLVGPRPLPAEQVSANIELLGPRHEVRAGITGWWQVHGRSDLDPDEALRMDHFYIENWSPALDVYILLRTVAALSTRRGAY